jgi:dihydropteroate synthase
MRLREDAAMAGSDEMTEGVASGPQSARAPRRWSLAHGRSLELGARGHLMGIVNVTPDSFSDPGLLADRDEAIRAALEMVEAGAAIIDVGGESTRPDAAPVDAATEQARVLPVIEAIAARSDVLISVDTYRAETGRKAIALGAHILNDVYGLRRDPALADVAAETGAGLCIMHTGRDREKLPDVIADQFEFFGPSLEVARRAGVRDEQIVLDPGFGFAKDETENLALMGRFGELQRLGLPFVVGTSRKRFVGFATGRPQGEREIGTAATTALLRVMGASIFRVHDVAVNKDALAMADAMMAAVAQGKGQAAA